MNDNSIEMQNKFWRNKAHNENVEHIILKRSANVLDVRST
jgi:hypothetical protein